MMKFYNCTALLLLVHTANITPRKNQQNPGLYLLIGNKAYAFLSHLITAPALLRALHKSLSR